MLYYKIVIASLYPRVNPTGVIYSDLEPLIYDGAVVVKNATENTTEVYSLSTYPQIGWKYDSKGWNTETGQSNAQ